MEQDGTEDVEGSRVSGDPESGSAALAALVATVESLAREVEALGTRLTRLEGARVGRGRGGSAKGRRKATASESVEVVMKPLPEIAMAAVAERALRRAEPVQSVEKADASGDGRHAARYRIEVVPGADLVGEVEKTLPVTFQASEGESGALLFELEW